MKKLFVAVALVASAFGLSACSEGVAQQVGVQGQVGVGVINNTPPAYGPPAYRGGYVGPNQYQQPTMRRVTGAPVAPQTVIKQHPPGTPKQYRCLYEGPGAQPVGPDGFNSWCD